MIIDVVYTILLCYFFFKGFNKGFVVALLTFAATIIGLIASLKLSDQLATVLFKNNIIAARWCPAIAFALIFVLVIILSRLIAKMLDGILKFSGLSWANKLIGGLAYALIISIVSSALFWILSTTGIVTDTIVSHSLVYKYIVPLAPKMFATIGIVFPWVRESLSNLTQFFDVLKK